MTDYDRLAQRIVAQGLGFYEAGEYYIDSPPSYAFSSESFCHEGRVVLALMEKACTKEDVDGAWGRQDGKWWSCIEDYGQIYFPIDEKQRDSLAITIVEACLEALEQ